MHYMHKPPYQTTFWPRPTHVIIALSHDNIYLSNCLLQDLCDKQYYVIEYCIYTT